MNRKQSIVLWVGLAVILLMAVIFAVTVWPTKYKYLPVEAAHGPMLALRINRLTGETEAFDFRTGWGKIYKEKEKVKSLQLLPPEEVKKIDATSIVEEPLSRSPISKDFIVEIYNGSSYILKEIAITITAKEKNGDIRWSRQFRRSDINIVPEKSGGRRIEIPSFDGAELSWSIDEFRGTPIIK